ncbi:MAG: DUF1028 domain-containing protein [Ignavibacteria bacterium]|nr:DUF1028 domain-containing protein [Ignavibacteria bacterium]MBT8383280.1 DUF1028 domain-containing protein [Ignavibacteria bacterium]MBT8390906.1 DUF1028 domain-containing protein [Ignavibacteria bacterium]NNJ52679.1 DUF1028 domain-containing protein [Ignavibacteriaceae bacterium]NNL20572.1 DUF1028 domain-containing protein [Ignavibacteriaceae bacterium]
MKRKYLFSSALILIFILQSHIFGQDTFSIVAVDTVTGEIGSAGASCVGPFGGVGAFILSDVIEGIGAIHTQASYNSTNQQNARARMLEGLSPQEIIDWLIANDAQNDPTVRQYGIVDLTRNGESAAYTGANCLDYKNHITGDGYSVQGNILLGQVIIDTMQTMFLTTDGPLADKLMASLQAAKIVGADTRCAVRNTSSQSGFVKVVRIGDGNTPYIQLVVPDTPIGTDPIDVLQGMFNDWKDSLFTVVDPFLSEIIADPDSLPADGTAMATIIISPKNNSDTLLTSGLQVELSNSGAGLLSGVTDLGNGTYQATITAPLTIGNDTISAFVISGIDTTSIFQESVVKYFIPTSVNDKLIKPDQYYLYQNYPQPFNPNTTLKFQIPESTDVVLEVFDMLGNKIITLINETVSKGIHILNFDGSNLPSGIYFYAIKAGEFSDTKKMVLIK